MQKDTLVRVGGAAAILAGLLRAAAAVVPGTGSEVERQSVYFIVDLLLLLGLLAAYAQHHQSLGRSGAGAFLITVTGLLLVRSSRAVPGLDLYPAGAASFAIGWVVLGFTWWKWSHGSPLVPLLVLLSLLLGVVSQLGGRAATLFATSGLLFGAAMVEVGRQLLVTAASASGNPEVTERPEVPPVDSSRSTRRDFRLPSGRVGSATARWPFKKIRDRNHVAGHYALRGSARRVERDLLERMPWTSDTMTAAATACVAHPDPTTGDIHAMNTAPNVAVSSTSTGVHNSVPTSAQLAKTRPGNRTSPAMT